ncbi:hypothetical protein GCM10010430_29670 [Kitasatospora cystarginea]|uniref:Uncharacterized protein n=1 Tax=Kitasatospora cystarginea TaxID=58350 RepID=A0ABP5QW52_9ACTN
MTTDPVLLNGDLALVEPREPEAAWRVHRRPFECTSEVRRPLVPYPDERQHRQRAAHRAPFTWRDDSEALTGILSARHTGHSALPTHFPTAAHFPTTAPSPAIARYPAVAHHSAGKARTPRTAPSRDAAHQVATEAMGGAPATGPAPTGTAG